jgi:hypothetical protein
VTTPTLESITGLVEAINAKGTGIKVAGQWANVSAYHAIAELPKLGQRVEALVQRTDRGLWINRIEVLDDGRIHELPIQLRRGGRSQSDPREIRRLAVLKAAAIFAASRPELKSADVLTLADRWIAWVQQPERRGLDQ